MMKKTIDRNTYRQAFRELQEKAYEITNGTINVFEKSWDFSNPVELGVNWSALGTVSVADAEIFATKMMEVANLIKNFKYNGYMIEY